MFLTLLLVAINACRVCGGGHASNAINVCRFYGGAHVFDANDVCDVGDERFIS